MTKRYYLTGFALVIALVVSVSVARRVQGNDPLAVGGSDVKRKGPDTAPVKLVVYSDFQCPACKGAVEPIEILRAQFADRMQVVFRHYPLERNHRWAFDAARFAECAGEQGRFWEFHDRVFEEQAKWAADPDPIAVFWKYILRLGLDEKEVSSCLADPRTVERIRKEQASGTERQVRSTPTIFINEERVVGWQQLAEKGAEMVQAELEKRR